MQQTLVTIAHIDEGTPGQRALHLGILQFVASIDRDGLTAALPVFPAACVTMCSLGCVPMLLQCPRKCIESTQYTDRKRRRNVSRTGCTLLWEDSA